MHSTCQTIATKRGDGRTRRERKSHRARRHQPIISALIKRRRSILSGTTANWYQLTVLNRLIRCVGTRSWPMQQSSQDAVSRDHVGIIIPPNDKFEHRKERLEDPRGFVNDNPRHLAALLWQAPAIRDQIRHDDQRTEKQVRCTSRAALRLRAVPVTRHRWVLSFISCFIYLSLSYPLVCACCLCHLKLLVEHWDFINNLAYKFRKMSRYYFHWRDIPIVRIILRGIWLNEIFP